MHYNNKNVGHVYTLWVDREMRRSGIRQGLKLKAEDWAKTQKLAHIFTWVNVENKKMIALNEKLGYQVEEIKMIKKI